MGKNDSVAHIFKLRTIGLKSESRLWFWLDRCPRDVFGVCRRSSVNIVKSLPYVKAALGNSKLSRAIRAKSGAKRKHKCDEKSRQ